MSAKSPKYRVIDAYELNQFLDHTDFLPKQLEAHDLEFYEYIAKGEIQNYYRDGEGIPQEVFYWAQRARALLCHIKFLEGYIDGNTGRTSEEISESEI